MSKGNEILLAARTHSRAARTVESLRRIAVPEWGDAELYFWPKMDVTEKREVFRHFSGMGRAHPSELIESAISQVLIRSRDAFGNRLFADDQEAALRDVDPDVLMRVAGEMGWSAASVEDAEKN